MDVFHENTKMKILNLYAGIGGNRKLWGDKHEITAIEIDSEIAKIYQDFFPNDKVIVIDAHQYLLEHYREFDFIWSSPPCPTHSKIKEMTVKIGRDPLMYPDMKLYEEIIILQEFYKGKWVVENVVSYYDPLIKPRIIGRHYFWSNFIISKIKLHSNPIIERTKIDNDNFGFDISGYSYNTRKDQILRNLVNPKLGLHIFEMAFKKPQLTLI